MRVSSENIQSLEENEIFVFGSNLAGRHGKGAAKQALEFGAKYGSGFGEYGQTFAIPTKDAKLNILDINEIKHYVSLFITIAKVRPQRKYLVTQIGCGLSNYSPSDIAPLFKDALDLENVYLPKSFIDVLIQSNENSK